MKALLLVAHGSKSPKAGEEVAALAAALRAAAAGWDFVGFAYLDVQSPDIPEGLARCVDAGAKEILVLPHFLNSGGHVLRDIPGIVDAEKSRYKNVHIRIAPAIGSHERLVELYLDLVRKAS